MWINDGTADKVLKQKRTAAARRYMLACDVLDGFRFRGKRSGFYIWLDLPGEWTGQALEQAAHQQGVNVFGAEKFTVGDTPAPPAARISLTGPDSLQELEKGLRIIKKILNAQTIKESLRRPGGNPS